MAIITSPIQLTLPFDGPTKVCSVCRIDIPVTNFDKARHHKDGLFSCCKKCRSERGRAYYQAHKERICARTGATQRANRERSNAYTEKWRKNNRAHYLAGLKRTVSKWRATHRDVDSACSRRWAKANPDKVLARIHRRKTRIALSGGSFTGQEWQELKARFDYRCLRCGKQEPEIKLTVDHVLPIILGGTSDISNIQPLCRPCNSSKQAKHIDYR